MFKPKRNRVHYGLSVLVIVVFGLLSRRYSYLLPSCVNIYLGDALWAMMVYFLFATIFRNSSIGRVALAALLFSFTIEFSQLYHAAWIDYLRSTLLGGLVLGFVFLWTDLIAYTLGILICILFECFKGKVRTRYYC